MRRLGQASLRLAGLWSLAIAVLHVGVIAAGAPAYRFVGAGEDMARLAEQGSLRPALLTGALALGFAVFAAYGFSGARLLPRLPFLKLGLLAIGTIYTLRGLLLAPQIAALTRFPGQFPTRYLLFSVAALVVGLTYLVGARLCWKHLGPREPEP
jgi:hypothetical protein